MQKQAPEVFLKSVLKNFAIFTGKHLRWILLFNKVAGIPTQVSSCEYWECLKKPIMKNICERLLFDM